MPKTRQIGPIPVWPYFFLAAATAILGTVFIAVWWPPNFPDESQLVKISGDIDKVTIRNEISKSSAGAMLPAMTSVYFKLKGVDGEFRYPSTHPKYPLVRDYTAVAIDIWVLEADTGTAEPVKIWQIEERNPRDDASELTKVGYDEIIERLSASGKSMVRLGYWLFAACCGFLLLGVGVRKWNRGRPHRLE